MDRVTSTGAWLPFWRPTVRRVSFKNITDGSSKTTLILERAGLPDHYFENGRKFEPHDPPKFRTWGNVGLWAISAETLTNHVQIGSGTPIVNGDNLHGLYSFHPGGAQAAFVDGSVQFIRDSRRHDPQRAKNDPGDAKLLAEFIRDHNSRLRPWIPDDVHSNHLALL